MDILRNHLIIILKDFIINSWSNLEFKGEMCWSRFYFKMKFIEGYKKIITRYVSNKYDTGYVEEIEDILSVNKK